MKRNRSKFGTQHPPSRLAMLPEGDRAAIDTTLREMIIMLARRQAWQDHLAEMKPKTD